MYGIVQGNKKTDKLHKKHPENDIGDENGIVGKAA